MKVLLLAGTGEAREIAKGLAGKNGVDLVASLAGATRHPMDLPCHTRIGGFGGVDGFREELVSGGFQAVIDATHPYAAHMSSTAAKVCREIGVPHLRVLRPEWRPGPGDLWTMIDREEQVADLAPTGATVFLATGRKTLERFANLVGRRVICRQIDPANGPFPFPGGEYQYGRPPFSVADEIALFRGLKVDWLVVKNSGGKASATKLVAARELALPVAMIRRPVPPDCEIVETAGAALDWVERL